MHLHAVQIYEKKQTQTKFKGGGVMGWPWICICIWMDTFACHDCMSKCQVQFIYYFCGFKMRLSEKVDIDSHIGRMAD